MTKIEMETMDAVIGIRRELAKANEIDWEKRRYEVAKALYPMVLEKTPEECLPSSVAITCIGFANVFVKELKKFNEREKSKKK